MHAECWQPHEYWLKRCDGVRLARYTASLPWNEQLPHARIDLARAMYDAEELLRVGPFRPKTPTTCSRSSQRMPDGSLLPYKNDSIADGVRHVSIHGHRAAD